LAEIDPEAARLLQEAIDRSERSERQLAEQATRFVTSECTTKLSEVKGDFGQLPPSVSEKLLPVAVQLTEKGREELFGALDHLAKTGLVKLGEKGANPSGGGSTDKDGTKAFMDAVAEKVKNSQGKLSMGEAIGQVAGEDPQLYNEYRLHQVQLAEEVR
jgi:hypothetical protein